MRYDISANAREHSRFIFVCFYVKLFAFVVEDRVGVISWSRRHRRGYPTIRFSFLQEGTCPRWQPTTSKNIEIKTSMLISHTGRLADCSLVPNSPLGGLCVEWTLPCFTCIQQPKILDFRWRPTNLIASLPFYFKVDVASSIFRYVGWTPELSSPLQIGGGWLAAKIFKVKCFGLLGDNTKT